MRNTIVGLYSHKLLHKPIRTVKAYRNFCKKNCSTCALVMNCVIRENGDLDNENGGALDQQQFHLAEVVCIPKMFN